MNNLVMAYLGDAVFELYVRKYLIDSGLSKVNDLQKSSVKFVSAVGERKILEYLESKNFFRPEEEDIIKRARNAHSHSSKTTDIVTYKKSTGFEALVGHLYINDRDRLETLMKEVFKSESVW